MREILRTADDGSVLRTMSHYVRCLARRQSDIRYHLGMSRRRLHDRLDLYALGGARNRARSVRFGGINPSNDLGALLKLCEDRDLNVVARLGPQINGEMTWFGFPRCIVEGPELHSLSASPEGNAA